jgi:hypothetical protein
MTTPSPSLSHPARTLRLVSLVTDAIARWCWRPRARLSQFTFVPASEFKSRVISIKVQSLRRAALKLQSLSFVPLEPGRPITLPTNARAKPLQKGESYTQLCHPQQIFREGQSWEDLACIVALDQFNTQHRLYIASFRQIARQRLQTLQVASAGLINRTVEAIPAYWHRN